MVDDPAYPGLPSGAGVARRGTWGAVLMSVGAALAVAAMLVYAPPGAGGSSLR